MEKTTREYTWYNASRDAGKLLIVGVLICMSFIFGVVYKKSEVQPQIDSLQIKLNNANGNIYNRTVLNWENIDYWLEYFKVQYPDIIKAQIVQECGWNLDSKKAIQNNNILGLTKATQRLTTATYIEDGHAGYPNFISCIKDFSIYQQKYYNGNDYYEFIQKSNYSQDSTYIKKIKIIVKKMMNNKK